MPFGILASGLREAIAVARASTPTHRRVRDYLVGILLATAGVDLICATVGFFAERHVAETEIRTFGSALFWTTTQLLTVSSNIHNPTSVIGRILDIFMEVWAISVIATLAGAMGAFIRRRGEEIDALHAHRTGAKPGPGG